MKRMIAVLIGAALALQAAGAAADAWDGTVAARETVPVTAPAQGVIDSLALEAGARVTGDDTAGTIRTEKVFAPFDGTVAAVSAEDGDQVSGTVMEISPVSLYTVACTVTGVAKTPENALIHTGEKLYIRCTADGSHRAAARVTAVSGAEFTAETTAGELYVGEAVWLYRDAAFTAESRVGKGTVTAHDPLEISAEGVVDGLRVQAGDRVERGQWLFSISSSGDCAIRIPASGIVTEVTVSAGDPVSEDQELAVIAVACVIRVPVPADEAGLFTEGRPMAYIRGDDPHETMYPCRVSRVLSDPENASATVELVPEEDLLLPVGMNITVVDSPDRMTD